MSTSNGAILVLPQGKASVAQIEGALGPWLQGAERIPAEGELRRWDLPGISDASLFVRAHPVGFDLLVLRFSSNEYAGDPEKVKAWVQGFFQAALGLGPLFGFLTRYDSYLEDPRLADEVLIPLLMEEWDELRAKSFEMVWIPEIA